MHDADFWVQKHQKSRERGGCVLDTALTHLLRALLLLPCSELPVRRVRSALLLWLRVSPWCHLLWVPLGAGTGAASPKAEPPWLKPTGKAVRMCCRVRQSCPLGSSHVPFPSLTAGTCSFQTLIPGRFLTPHRAEIHVLLKIPHWIGRKGMHRDGCAQRQGRDSDIPSSKDSAHFSPVPAAAQGNHCPHCWEGWDMWMAPTARGQG